LFMNLTDPKGNSEIWKDIYGFDYSLPVDLAGWEKTDTLNSLDSPLQVTGLNCSKQCMYAENFSEFAKKCRKDGGHFKCCLTNMHISVFDDVRKGLQKLGLIDSDPFEGRDLTQRFHCSLTYSCTKQDVQSGKLTTEYNTPEVNPIGGYIHNDPNTNERQRVGFRNSYCVVQDYCLGGLAITLKGETYRASSRNEYCKIQQDIIREKERKDTKLYMETLDECTERKSVVRICPKKHLEKINSEELNKMNAELMEYRGELKSIREKRRKDGGKKSAGKY